jgi:TPR repeat protein
MNCWQRLNISETRDKTLIEQAYLTQKHSPDLSDADQLDLHIAYQQAIQFADVELVENGPVSHSFEPVVNTPNSAAEHANQGQSGSANVPTTNSWSAMIKGALVLAGLYLIAVSIMPDQQAKPDAATKLKATDWFEQLADCEALTELSEDEQFDRCLALAEKGSVRAQKKLAWLYFDSNTKENMQLSFDWFNRAGNSDSKALLFSNVLLLANGDTEEAKLSAFKRIVEMTARGDAFAEAYLAVIYYLELNPIPRTVNQTWLMEKAYSRNEGAVSVYDLARIHYNGFDTPTNIAKARQLLIEYSESEFPDSANDIAWLLATLKNEDFVGSDVALNLAESVVDDPNYSDNYAYVDTLAAAYANIGEFDKATEVQRRAIGLLADAAPDLDEEEALELQKSFDERLEKYLSQQPERIFNLRVKRENFFEAIKSDIEGHLLDDAEFSAHKPE